MDNSKKLKKSDLSITVLLIIGIVLVVNFFSYQLFHRFDLTEGEVFSISQASKDTAASLDDVVTITAYFSANLPSQVLAIKQEVADLLAEYEAYSDGKVKVSFVDPNDDEKIQQQLMMIGIPQLTFEVYEKDKRQLVNGYMGIAVAYGAKTEAIPAIKRDTSDLEYQLTTAIKKATTDEIATIGVLTGFGSHDLAVDMKGADQQLKELYTVAPVTLSGDAPTVADNIDTLLILGPKETMAEPVLKAIDKFVARGGALLALLDGVTIGEGLSASKNTTGLETLLTKYGINANQDLVADAQSGVASFSQGFMTFSSNYPFWPLVSQGGFSPDSSAVSGLENVIFPWASSVDTDANKLGGATVVRLAQSTERSWKVADNFNILPNLTMAPQGTQQPYPLAVAVNGAVTRAYPAGSDSPTMDARLVVVGDSDFAADNFIGNNPDNLTLFQNLVDSLSFDEALISIRSKGVTSRPIAELSDTARAAVRYLNIFGLTLAVVAFGLIRYFLRRRSRFVDEL